MKKLFKKNQLIITALALMIAVAGYISFVGDQGKDEGVVQQASADVMDEAYTYEIADDMEIQEEDIFTDTEDHSTELAMESTVENPGESVLVSASSGTMDQAAQMKLSREQVRSKNREALNQIIENDSLEESQKQAAVDQLVELTDIAEREAAAEMLLEAKGFTNVVVSITDGSADVVLDMGEVTDAKRAQVEDIVKRKTNIDAANIVITPH